MPRYLVERNFARISEADIEAVGTRSKRAARDLDDAVVWEHSHVVVDGSGEVRTYCVYEAPDEATIRRHGDLFGSHTIDAIHEIVDDITPADFPD